MTELEHTPITRRRAGFTLIEVVVAMVVIAVLATISIVGYRALIGPAGYARVTARNVAVTRAAAMVVAANPSWTPEQVMVEVLNQTTPAAQAVALGVFALEPQTLDPDDTNEQLVNGYVLDHFDGPGDVSRHANHFVWYSYPPLLGFETAGGAPGSVAYCVLSSTGSVLRPCTPSTTGATIADELAEMVDGPGATAPTTVPADDTGDDGDVEPPAVTTTTLPEPDVPPTTLPGEHPVPDGWESTTTTTTTTTTDPEPVTTTTTEPATTTTIPVPTTTTATTTTTTVPPADPGTFVHPHTYFDSAEFARPAMRIRDFSLRPSANSNRVFIGPGSIGVGRDLEMSGFDWREGPGVFTYTYTGATDTLRVLASNHDGTWSVTYDDFFASHGAGPGNSVEAMNAVQMSLFVRAKNKQTATASVYDVSLNGTPIPVGDLLTLTSTGSRQGVHLTIDGLQLIDPASGNMVFRFTLDKSHHTGFHNGVEQSVLDVVFAHVTTSAQIGVANGSGTAYTPAPAGSFPA